jgi:hypothetical protein
MDMPCGPQAHNVHFSSAEREHLVLATPNDDETLV